MEIRYEKAQEADAEELIEVQNKAFYADYIKYGEYSACNRSMDNVMMFITKEDTFKIIADNKVVGEIEV